MFQLFNFNVQFNYFISKKQIRFGQVSKEDWPCSLLSNLSFSILILNKPSVYIHLNNIYFRSIRCIDFNHWNSLV